MAHDVHVLKDLAMSLLWQLPYDARRNLFRLAFPFKFHTYQRMRELSEVSEFALGPFEVHRCIFIHIPKCAGISVSRGLFGRLVGTHNSIKTFQLIYPKEQLDRYFKFTFVRNPWDRLVSAYRFLKSGGFNAEDKAWADANLRRFVDFRDFVRRWVTPANVNSWQHFKPQYRFITDPSGQMPMDYLGYFENLRNDFRNIANLLGLRVKLPHHNSSPPLLGDHHYTEKYDAETREIVASVYKRDIELLGYDFEKNIVPSRFHTQGDIERIRRRLRSNELDLEPCILPQALSH